MKVINNSFLIIAFALIACPLHAQTKLMEDSTRYQRMSVTFLPQYLINQAIRIDIEKPIGTRMDRLTISPYLYAGPSTRYQDQKEYRSSSASVPDDYEQVKVEGFGLEASIKHLIRNGRGNLTNWYIAYGGAFHHINLQYQNFVPVPYQEGGLEYYRYMIADQQENINRMELLAMIGIKLYLFDSRVLFLDVYAGPVYKKSWIGSSQANPLIHDAPIDFGFTGVTYRGGIGLGLTLY